MAKYSKKVEERAWLLSVADINGWLLVFKDEDSDGWLIAWTEPFPTKKSALKFATDNRWTMPYRAVRGRLTLRPQMKSPERMGD